VRAKVLIAVGAALSLAALAVAAPVSFAGAAAPAADPTIPKPGWTPPKNAEGQPDLSGYWTNATITPLTRNPKLTDKATLPPAEARAVEKTWANALAAADEPTDPNSGAEASKAKTGDAKLLSIRPEFAAAGGDVGGYNAFWLDPGNTMGFVKGQYRTAWIVDPADGQLPFSAQGKALTAKAAQYSRDADRPDNPEAFEPWDRCIISSRGSGGPGMLNNIYNSNYQIVQTPAYVAIEVEMIHDARGVPVFPSKAAAQAAHGPAALALWLGDSTGWWEGDTFVVETVNVNAEQGRAGPLFLTPKGKVTERFTRVSKDQILYAFEVEDPVYYSRPWKAEMSLNAGPKAIYEYACHEGNYALPDILSGMRAGERAAAGKTNAGGK
jgi:hypothetical protein